MIFRVARAGALAMALPFVLQACGIVSPAKRAEDANAIATAAGWRPVLLPASPLALVAYIPAQQNRQQRRHLGPANPIAGPDTEPRSQLQPNLQREPRPDPQPKSIDTLTVYIEGDGLAWISATVPSDDPTPSDPVALRLALQHPAGQAAYLARPCQYLRETVNGKAGNDKTIALRTVAAACRTSLWTDGRFSSDVIRSMNDAVSLLKTAAAAHRIRLVGFSGGGAVAALVAARRDDVDLLVTVAGNLDTMAWTRHHGVPPLTISLNPADAWPQLVNVPQVHFVGTNDAIVPPGIVEAYAGRFPADHRHRVRIVEDFGHHCCWAKAWSRLAATVFSASE